MYKRRIFFDKLLLYTKKCTRKLKKYLFKQLNDEFIALLLLTILEDIFFSSKSALENIEKLVEYLY